MNKGKKQSEYSRRAFLKTTSVTAGTVGALGLSAGILAQEVGKPSTAAEGLPVKLAGYKYSRIQALLEGRATIEGCDLQFQPAKIGDMNSDVFSGAQSREVTEIGLHPFMLAYANDKFRDYTLLPIFPLRTFRHKSVFIRTDRGINKPHDLLGKRIATPNYSSSSLTWLRGIFEDEYGIAPRDVHWVASSADSSASLSGQTSKQENMLPEGVAIEQGVQGMDESQLLESGDVDALFHAVEPRAFTEGHPMIARLFPDYRSVEKAYFAKTGIFPIMHAVAIRKTTLNQYPWLAKAVFNAYSQAKEVDYQRMAKTASLMDSLPWYGQEFDETRALMGENYYSYGLKPNRKVLETFFRYSFEQGLSSRELTIEELFDPSSLEFVES